jgi:hypothetical protein
VVKKFAIPLALIALIACAHPAGAVVGTAKAVVSCTGGHAMLTVTASVPAGYTIVSGTGTFDRGTSTAAGTAKVQVRHGTSAPYYLSASYGAKNCALPAVQITAASEKCWATGNTEVTVDVKANSAGTYDLLSRGDNGYATLVETFTLAAGATYEIVYPISNPAQVDNVVTNAAAGIDRPLASKTVPAATVCAN